MFAGPSCQESAAKKGAPIKPMQNAEHSRLGSLHGEGLDVFDVCRVMFLLMSGEAL